MERQEFSRIHIRGEFEKYHAGKKASYLEAHTGFETLRRCHHKSKTGVSVAPQKDICPLFLKKERNEK